MNERKIGGSYQCRVCGDIHSCFPCNQKTLPLQGVQISIENIEDFFVNSSMSVETRKTFEESFKELRKILDVPEEKIYNRESLMGTDEQEKVFCGFNPTFDVLGRASAIISRICDFAVNNVYVTKPQEESMMMAISSLKNKVFPSPTKK